MWWYDPARMPDEIFNEIKTQRNERGEDLLEDRPDTLPANLPIIDLIHKYGSLFSNGMGGINADGIRLVMELEDISKNNMSVYTQKITAFVSGALEAQKKDKT